MRTTIYRATDDSTIEVTEPQRNALERAGKWRGYKLVTAGTASPTHTDAEVADMIAGHAAMTRIARKVRPYLGTHNYVVAVAGGPDSACESIESALDEVQRIGAKVVTMPIGDAHASLYPLAAERDITILAV